MENTDAESVDDIVAASNKDGISEKWMLVHDIPESHQINNPVNNVVNRTPNVDSMIPGRSTGRMSVKRVSIPPVKRMTLSAIVPRN